MAIESVTDESVLKNFNEAALTNKISGLYGEIEKQDTLLFFPLVAADIILFGLSTKYQAWIRRNWNMFSTNATIHHRRWFFCRHVESMQDSDKGITCQRSGTSF